MISKLFIGFNILTLYSASIAITTTPLLMRFRLFFKKLFTPSHAVKSRFMIVFVIVVIIFSVLYV